MDEAEREKAKMEMELDVLSKERENDKAENMVKVLEKLQSQQKSIANPYNPQFGQPGKHYDLKNYDDIQKPVDFGDQNNFEENENENHYEDKNEDSYEDKVDDFDSKNDYSENGENVGDAQYENNEANVESDNNYENHEENNEYGQQPEDSLDSNEVNDAVDVQPTGGEIIPENQNFQENIEPEANEVVNEAFGVDEQNEENPAAADEIVNSDTSDLNPPVYKYIST